MTQFPVSTSGEPSIHGALEPSKNGWLWVRHQPGGALTQWFHHRTQGRKGRIRRVMIVALARKPAIAFWRYLETGLIPEGAVVKLGG